MVNSPSVSRVHWTTSWRVVPSRFPPVTLFDRVTDADDIDAVLAIEGITNDRLRNEIGELRLVPKNEQQFGPGTTPIMASFTHLNPEGSRFSDGSYGVYYAANDIETALAETRYHRERFLLRTNEPPIDIDMRSYKSEIKTELHDIRNMQKELSSVYDENSYSASQKLARDLRNNSSNGMVYDSVRRPEGECVGIFKANIPQPVTQGSHYCFQWDGSRIANTYRKTAC
jgi:hypothetical protein